MSSLPYWYRAALQQEREDDLRRQAAHKALVQIAQAAHAPKRHGRHRARALPLLARMRQLVRGT